MLLATKIYWLYKLITSLSAPLKFRDQKYIANPYTCMTYERLKLTVNALMYYDACTWMKLVTISSGHGLSHVQLSLLDDIKCWFIVNRVTIQLNFARNWDIAQLDAIKNIIKISILSRHHCGYLIAISRDSISFGWPPSNGIDWPAAGRLPIRTAPHLQPRRSQSWGNRCPVYQALAYRASMNGQLWT